MTVNDTKELVIIKILGAFRGIKFTSRTKEIWYKIIEERFKYEQKIGEQVWIHTVRENNRHHLSPEANVKEELKENRKPHLVFIDLEERHGRVSREKRLRERRNVSVHKTSNRCV